MLALELYVSDTVEVISCGISRRGGCMWRGRVSHWTIPSGVRVSRGQRATRACVLPAACVSAAALLHGR